MATNNTGVVSIHGREYETVALRVKKFREKCPEYRLTTEIVSRDDECVVMKATIASDKGDILATGHSEEYRHTSQINRTSALENAETSAIGRALAALGLGGTEFASADEVANAITQQKRITPVAGSLENLSSEEQQRAKEIANSMVDLWGEGKEIACYEAYYMAGLSNELMLGVWEILQPHSKMRNTIKKIHRESTTKEAA
jgi:hypothetical protein